MNQKFDFLDESIVINSGNTYTMVHRHLSGSKEGLVDIVQVHLPGIKKANIDYIQRMPFRSAPYGNNVRPSTRTYMSLLESLREQFPGFHSDEIVEVITFTVE